MLPWDNLSPKVVLNRNTIGSNTGNLLFFNSVVRTLMTEDDTEFALANPLEKGRNAIETALSGADLLVMPFANAFRKDFNIRAWVDCINAAKIPCVVVGIGAQFPLDLGNNKGSGCAGLDKNALDFCRAVLKKSASIGVRGEITYDYLRWLGLSHDEVDIIGCPSMFSNPQLKIHNSQLGGELSNLKIATNGSGFSKSTGADYRNPPQFLKFLNRIWKEYPGSVLIPQELDEGLAVWQGRDPDRARFEPTYPHSPNDPMFRQNRVRFFVNAPSWLEYLGGFDFVVGNRIHGTVAALLGGTPAMLVPTDSRTLELARYHEIPHIENLDNLNSPDSIYSLYHQALERIPAMKKRGRENFAAYLSFLEKNGISHIYNEGPPAIVPYDRKISGISFHPPVEPFSAASGIQRLLRIESSAERAVYRAYRRFMGIRDNS